MKDLLKKYLSNLMTFGLERVAAGAATKCCYFILYQPKVPENLKKFSNKQK
ncbi:MAG: cyclic lactone autoinducer peptide [Clostridiales bacterium]|nr:cyclic lactone autoinducer peptide [Clostridiales bacterium]